MCVCSDLMHLINNDNITHDNKFEFFKQKIKNIGIPVGLTSLTTAIVFFKFLFFRSVANYKIWHYNNNRYFDFTIYYILLVMQFVLILICIYLKEIKN